MTKTLIETIKIECYKDDNIFFAKVNRNDKFDCVIQGNSLPALYTLILYNLMMKLEKESKNV